MTTRAKISDEDVETLSSNWDQEEKGRRDTPFKYSIRVFMSSLMPSRLPVFPYSSISEQIGGEDEDIWIVPDCWTLLRLNTKYLSQVVLSPSLTDYGQN